MTDAAEAREVVVATTANNDEILGEGGLKALKAEREAKAAAEKRASDVEAKLQEYIDREKTDAEKAQERLDAAEKRAAELELKATRAEVAAGSGVPIDLLTPVSGSVEDIQAFADALIAWRGDQVADAAAPEYSIPAAGRRPENLALNGDGIESALKKALGI